MNENPRLDSSSWLQCIFSHIFSFYHDASYVCNKLKTSEMINFMKLLQLILLKYLEYKAFVFCSEGKNFLFC